MSSRAPRIAVLGLHLEANAFAPPTLREDFTQQCWEEGERISVLARQVSHLPSELPGFYARMDATGPWTAVPVVVIGAPPGGPMAQDVFLDFLDLVRRGLAAALPLDGVYVASHGASSATGDVDSDGTLLELVRRIVGPAVPVVVTHDLHCNVSERLIAATDALIAYRTNPHVDARARAAEAADLMRRLLAGERTAKAFIRLPIAPPSVTLLTAEGPYADLIALGGKGGKYFPVLIELKGIRSFDRVLKQLVDAQKEMAKVKVKFIEMLAKGTGKTEASISFDDHKLLVVWPKASSGKGTASAAKAVADSRFEQAKGHLLIGEFNIIPEGTRDGFHSVVEFDQMA